MVLARTFSAFLAVAILAHVGGCGGPAPARPMATAPAEPRPLAMEKPARPLDTDPAELLARQPFVPARFQQGPEMMGPMLVAPGARPPSAALETEENPQSPLYSPFPPAEPSTAKPPRSSEVNRPKSSRPAVRGPAPAPLEAHYPAHATPWPRAPRSPEPIPVPLEIKKILPERPELVAQPVPWRQPMRTGGMRAVSEQAAVHIRRGFTLAGRKAIYSARSEFIRGLRIVAEALDAQTGAVQHTKALAAGLRALEEADDFLARGSMGEAPLDLAIIVPSHQTPVLRDVPLDLVTSVEACRRYYTFAQQQLAFAAGHDRSGSVALYGLGRVQTALAEVHQDISAAPKAIALHQAALAVDMDNYFAANEVGVLLARYGQYPQAREMLLHSVRLAPQSAAWHNLAVVHEKLGEHALAAAAQQQATLLAPRAENDGLSGVVWTDSVAFARTSSVTAGATPAGEKAGNAAPTSAVPGPSSRR